MRATTRDEFWHRIKRQALDILGPEKTVLINRPGGIDDLPHDKYIQRCQAVTELNALMIKLSTEADERASLETREKYQRMFAEARRVKTEYKLKKRRLLDLQLMLAERELGRKQRSSATRSTSATKRSFDKAVSSL